MVINEKKIKNLNILKRKNLSGDMVDRYFSPKLGVNSLHSFLENGFSDGRRDGRMTDTHVMTVPLLCSGTKQR